MIVRTPAIPLLFTPVSETSRAVTWMTLEAGRLVTLIKGSQRPKSAFLGQYDLFQTCELLYYHRDREGLLITRECCTLKARDRFRTDWRGCFAASYLADLVRLCTPIRSPAPELFHFLDRGLDGLERHGPDLLYLLWLELKLLDLLGLAPRLSACADCGKPPGTGAVWSAHRGGVICAACHAATGEGGVRLPPDILAALRHWQRAGQPVLGGNTRMDPGRKLSAARILGLFLRHHLDAPLASRRIAFRLLARESEKNVLRDPRDLACPP